MGNCHRLLKDLSLQFAESGERNRKIIQNPPQQHTVLDIVFIPDKANHFEFGDYKYGSAHIFCESETTNMATE